MTDLRHYATRLRKLLRKMLYPKWYSVRVESGNIQDLLQCLHYGFLDYSFYVTNLLTTTKYELRGKSDARFLGSCFRFLRNECQFFPSLTVSQFVSNSFLLKKLELVGDILTIIKIKHEEMQDANSRNEAKWTNVNRGSLNGVYVDNHLYTANTKSVNQMIENRKVPNNGERRGAFGHGNSQTNTTYKENNGPCSSFKIPSKSTVHKKRTQEGVVDSDVFEVRMVNLIARVHY
ncbi:hypothetical protein ABG067_001953 [Albugo candida]